MPCRCQEEHKCWLEQTKIYCSATHWLHWKSHDWEDSNGMSFQFSFVVVFFFCDQRVSIIFGLQLTADMILVLVCRYGWKIQLLFWSIYSFYFVYRLWFIIFASCKDLWQAGAPLSGRKTHPPWISVDFLDSMIFLPTIVVGNQHSATTWGTNMN